MNNQRFLHQYLNLQLGILFDQIRPVANSWFCSNQAGETPFWNQAVVTEPLNQPQVEAIEQTFARLNRQAAFYFPQAQELVEFSQFLSERGYEHQTSEVFMFHSGQNLNQLNHSALKKVETEADLEVFMGIFDRCYRGEDERVGRGSGFNQCLQSTQDDWRRFHRHNRVEFFILYYEQQPVGIISLTNFEGLGYLSNIGIVPDYQGLGLGKQITLSGVYLSKQHGNQHHFLIAERGGKPEKIYTKIGFKTALTCQLLVKSVASSSKIVTS